MYYSFGSAIIVVDKHSSLPIKKNVHCCLLYRSDTSNLPRSIIEYDILSFIIIGSIILIRLGPVEHHRLNDKRGFTNLIQYWSLFDREWYSHCASKLHRFIVDTSLASVAILNYLGQS